MVALLGLLEHHEVVVEHFLLRERDAIDALQLVALSVATPECTGHAREFHGLDQTSRNEVRTTAKVGERALRVGRNRAVFEVLVDVFALVGLTVGTKFLQSVGLRHFAAHDGFVFSCQFQHFLLDFREVAFLDDFAVFQQHVVEKSVLDSRSETELDARIEFFQRFGQKVGRSVPESMLSLVVVELEEGDGGVRVNGAVEFHCLTIDCARYNVACESRRDALGDLKTSYALFIRANRTIWECDFYHIQNSFLS